MPTDAKGLIGRECPNRDCRGYFKIKSGTGLKGTNIPCHCPYCGFTGAADRFHTREQVAYAKSVALNYVTDELNRALKRMEFDHRPSGPFGVGISLRVKEAQRHPIHSYREKELETDVICDRCTLVYAIFGAFAFCPDCGAHNSFTILCKNLEIAGKLLALAANQERALADQLVGDALENVISAFDGFGRELCKVSATKSVNAAEAADVRFQNLIGARNRLQKLFGLDMMTFVTASDWDFACRCFQKRHLLAHKMGVVDQDYIEATKDATATIGRKIQITPEEVKRLIAIVRALGEKLSQALLG
jgi:hypothetical protein